MTGLIYRNRDGVRRTLWIDPDRPHEVVVQTEQVLDEILEGIERDRELHPSSGTIKRLARIPISIYERSVLEGWDESDWARWLNSSDAAPFRIWQGRV